MFLLSYIRKARRVTTLYRLTGSGITLRKIKRIMLHATYTDRYSAYIRRKQLLPPFDEIFQISLVRSCVKVRLLVFGFLSKNAAKILLFFDIRKREGDFVLFLFLALLSVIARSWGVTVGLSVLSTRGSFCNAPKRQYKTAKRTNTSHLL